MLFTPHLCLPLVVQKAGEAAAADGEEAGATGIILGRRKAAAAGGEGALLKGLASRRQPHAHAVGMLPSSPTPVSALTLGRACGPICFPRGMDTKCERTVALTSVKRTRSTLNAPCSPSSLASLSTRV